jgi:hypothetical protein
MNLFTNTGDYYNGVGILRKMEERAVCIMRPFLF